MLGDREPISIYVTVLKLIHRLYFFIHPMIYSIIIQYLWKMNLIQEFNISMITMARTVYNNNPL